MGSHRPWKDQVSILKIGQQIRNWEAKVTHLSVIIVLASFARIRDWLKEVKLEEKNK